MDSRRGLGLVLLASCGASSQPLTGPVRRFAVDQIAVPVVNANVADWGDDLDGNGTVDDRVGAITVTLAGTMDLSLDSPSMIASGVLASSVEIQADDLTKDSSVGVTFFGADAETPTLTRGAFTAGAYRSQRTATTRAPGAATLHVPIFTNADPVLLPIAGEEIDLDPDGSGGYDGFVRGGIATQDALDAGYHGLVQMILDEPQRHLPFAGLVDSNHDGMISQDEVDAGIFGSLLEPDIQLFQNGHYAPNPKKTALDSISIAVKFHLIPCDAGTCVTTPAPQPCRDRVRNGSETDIDCGGSCQPCQAGAACAVAADCQSNACDAGHCRAPSCSDGLRDGLETDVDCGDNCSPCASGKICAVAHDCASGQCNTSIGALGTCQ